MIWFSARLAFVVLVSIAVAAPAEAASYDCAKARAADERAVCADRALDDQDVRMATLYGVSLGFLGMGARGAQMERQAAWLGERRRCRADRACLRRAYARRIAELEGIIRKAQTLGPL